MFSSLAWILYIQAGRSLAAKPFGGVLRRSIKLDTSRYFFSQPWHPVRLVVAPVAETVALRRCAAVFSTESVETVYDDDDEATNHINHDDGDAGL